MFVPELLTTPGDDPWARRKGEPRIFALLWCTYLMIGALLTIFSVRFLGIPDSDEYRGACIMMSVMGGIGAAILWPVVRLCQARPKRAVGSTLVDALVVAIPLQAVIWPMPMLTDWPFGVAMAIGGVAAGWTLVAGALIAWGYLTGRRLLAMGVALGLALVAPLMLMRGGVPLPDDPPPVWAVLSPLTAPWALTWSASGLSPRMDGGEWRAVVLVIGAGAVLMVGIPRMVGPRR